MKLNLEQLQKALCQAMCSQVRVTRKNEHLAIVDTPSFFADGDPCQIYLKEQPGGVIRLSDMGHTLMHLSYDNDIDAFRDGTRGNLLQGILAETEVKEENGEFYVDTPSDGHGSTPVSTATIARARVVLSALSIHEQPVDINADPDGEVSFDWRAGDVLLAVSLSEEGRLSYIYHNGAERMRDTTFLEGDTLPSALRALIPARP